MKAGQLSFIEYLAYEEQNLLTSIVNFRGDFDAFYNLDVAYQKPLSTLEVNVDEDILPSLYLFVHFHLYFSISSLFRSHFSESLASTRKALDASFSAYRIILEPETVELYRNRDRSFQFIKSYIQNERKKDPEKYPIAENLLELHDLCSEYGSHSDISSFVHRVESRPIPNTKKDFMMFHYFQFPRDMHEYAVYLIDTLWAYYGMLLIFRPFIEEKIKDSDSLGEIIDELGALITDRRNELYKHFQRTKPEVINEEA